VLGTIQRWITEGFLKYRPDRDVNWLRTMICMSSDTCGQNSIYSPYEQELSFTPPPPFELSINVNYMEQLVASVTILILLAKVKLELMLSLFLTN
jgi:hypothetical protein